MSVVAVSRRKLEVGSLWALALAVAVVAGWALFSVQGQLAGWVANAASLSRGEALALNYRSIAIGALIQGGVIWTVLYFAVVRRRAPGRGLSDLAVLLVASVLVQAAVMHFAVARADAAPADATMAQAELARAAGAAEARQATDPPLEVAGAAGDRRVLREAFNTMATQIRADRRRYSHEMMTYNFSWHLSPMALASYAGIERARLRLTKARTSIATYRAALTERIARARAGVAAGELDARPAALTGFDRATGQLEADVEKALAVQEALLGEYDAMVRMTADRGRFTYAGGKLTFRSAADQAAYRAHRERAQVLESQLDPKTGQLKAQGPVAS